MAVRTDRACPARRGAERADVERPRRATTRCLSERLDTARLRTVLLCTAILSIGRLPDSMFARQVDNSRQVRTDRVEMSVP